MLTIIHGADFHLDAPFAALPPDKARARRAEQRELLDRLAGLAEERRADVVLLSGDLLDGGQTYQETVQALARTLGGIPAPVFIAPGNHDCYGPRSVYAGTAWPDNVHIFSTVAVEGVELPGLNCVVHGAAFTTPQADRSPLMGFAAPRDGRIHLMALHGDVEGKGRYGPIALEDIAASGLTYLALGHIHACSGLQKAGDTYWAYPGCPEGRGFDELGDKGVLVVTVDDGGAVSAEFVPLARRRYEILTVDVTGAESPAAALAAALPADAGEDCYRIVLTGERGEEPPELAALAALAEPRFYSVTLRDQTRERRALWARGEYLLQREKVDLYASLSGLLAAFYNDFTDRGFDMEVELAEGLPQVWADAGAVLRIFTNLIRNALEHGEGRMEIRLYQEGGQVVSRFSNETHALTAEDVPHVFDRFFTSDKMRTGRNTGLGLAIVKALAGQMDCRAEAALEGDMFAITLRWPVERR